MENLTIKDEYSFKLMLQSNVDPLAQMHSSWLSHLPHGELCLKLAARTGAREKLQEYLQNHYAWMGKYDFEAIRWPGQLAILPAGQLQHVLLYLGIWYCSQEIRHLINARDVAKIRSALGENGYQFAIKLAPFLSGREMDKDRNKQARQAQGKKLLSALLKEKKLPSLRNSSAKQASSSEQESVENGIALTLQHIGLKLMFAELNLLAEPLKMRLFSKLPYCWYLERQQLQSDPLMAIDEKADGLLIKRILVECLPQCSNMLQ
ncbi:SctK family type III secretion system sorting platform protein [Thalassomonas haliotis]|uniref:SctK family type III secretion system sorting platform protein n=1 Tax=Thalassomonas haliotis TaxID=485448 RepID=A0ABY7V719_9GAMM|nr:SctK family type III secretion system sorting platform protein [Thalassomonas haliotis]WDE09421.1 SctK family type III secretion system sorting platform protein [Thalassomonas haliotis]